MIVELLTRTEAKRKYEKLITYDEKEELSPEYEEIRNQLISMYFTSKATKDKYKTDVNYALQIYKYFNESFPDFSMRYAACEDFWRYITVCVAPHVVLDRWKNSGGDNNGLADHFYENPGRIYFRALWWYIHLSKQETEEETKAVLFSENCDEDTIQGLVERPGSRGTYVSVYRKIMKKYSEYSSDNISYYKANIGKKADTFFRCLMKFNTAHVLITEPGLFEGGEDGYVDFLFEEMENSINASKNS